MPSIDEAETRATRFTIAALVGVPIVFNAIALFPELRAVPNLNDDAFHFLFVREAAAAMARGANPFDFWLPQLEMGIAQFFYYQHLPHVAVAALYWLLLGRVDLLTLFNLTRYLMLVGLPLTVYWSMRRMDFSPIAAAAGAACSSLISANYLYGFEYQTYTWRGQGMFSQLAAMHLLIISIACVYRTIERGTGCAAAIAASSALVLSNILNGTIMAVSAVALLALAIAWEPKRWRERVARLAIVAIPAGVITAYMSVPFFLEQKYLDISPYLQVDPYKAYGAAKTLTWIVTGQLFDFGRPAALTALFAIGIVAAIRKTGRNAQVALAVFIPSLLIYFGRPTWGRAIDFIPMKQLLIFNRFIGGIDLGAILLMGLGGEWIWSRFARVRAPAMRAIAPGILILAILFPAIHERNDYYRINTKWMEETRQAVASDPDILTILDTIVRLPPGRTYGGLRANWGKQLKWGYVHFFDLMTMDAIVAFGPPYQAMTLNGDVIWYFDDTNFAQYRLFNVRYVVAPASRKMPAFLTPIKKTAKYILYSCDTGGYGEFANGLMPRDAPSQASLLSQNIAWLKGNGPAADDFIVYNYERPGPPPPPPLWSPGKGTARDVAIGPDWMKLSVTATTPAFLVLKATYHPNWSVRIDGKLAQAYMVSPSFIGVKVPAGSHTVIAEYRSSRLKKILIVVAFAALGAVIWFRRELDALAESPFAEAEAAAPPPPPPQRKVSGRR
ncbi:MAG: hypothetical protein ACREQI_00950 [Candidatus Binataceae bacterium]